jgi:two-component system, OmpR family, KDP operon response regulator KdpE
MIGKERILVVDDDLTVRRILIAALLAGGFVAAGLRSGAEAIRRVAVEAPDAIILDLALHDMDGKEVIARVRTFSAVPVIVLSARNAETEKIAALDLGANDYINKPFAMGELMARLRAVLRHGIARPVEPDTIQIGDVRIDLAAHLAMRGGQELPLTPKEFDLLVLLARNAGRVVTHQQILNAIWGSEHVQDVQYLRVYIGQLRRKLGDGCEDQRLIRTEFRIGYRLRMS